MDGEYNFIHYYRYFLSGLFCTNTSLPLPLTTDITTDIFSAGYSVQIPLSLSQQLVGLINCTYYLNLFLHMFWFHATGFMHLLPKSFCIRTDGLNDTCCNPVISETITIQTIHADPWIFMSGGFFFILPHIVNTL